MAVASLHKKLRIKLYAADYLALRSLQCQSGLASGADVESALLDIRDMAGSVCERLETNAALGDIFFTLNDQLFNVLGFRCVGEGEVDPDSMLLHRVLFSRQADPLALGVLYITIGRWLGLSLRGCDYPGRFLIRYEDEVGAALIDPGSGGVQMQEADLSMLLLNRFGAASAEVGPQGLLSDIGDSDLVVRQLRRLKRAYLQRAEHDKALIVHERIMQLVPDIPVGFRERGQLFELLDCPRAAAKDYSRYLDLAPDAVDAAKLRQRMAQLMRQPLVLH